MKQITHWFSSLSTDKKVSVTLLVGVGIFVLTTIVSGLTQRYRLSEYGVYFVAKIYEISSSKDGAQYRIEYYYNNTRYTGGFKPSFDFKPNRVGAFIYIKLLPNDPEVHQYLEEGEVTDSIRMTLPRTGWRSLPDAPRQYLLNGHSTRIQ
ncbi:MAG: hypothetical protein EOP48_24640 [Sphingobacteriales bacterium]|nr:MAG: hypothetical protein EOP48_24640 [Sphingobacteriales bacterium]